MLELHPLQVDDYPILYRIGFSEAHPEWKQWDAPYFDDYVHEPYEQFVQKEWLTNANLLGIFVDNVLIGMVSCYWENEKTRWLEMGIIIYQKQQRSKGYGYQACSRWISRCFERFPEIERVGLTTWSGNAPMIRLAEKLGMQREACIRKVRYYKGVYYDSIKYGVLRSEWHVLHS